MNPGADAGARHLENQAATFFAELERLHSLACAATGTVERDLRLAGHRLRLRFAGEALVTPLTRALAHLLVAAEGEPDLTVLLWDVASTGSPLPPPPWGREAYTVRSEIAGYNDEDFHTAYQVATESLLMFDTRRRRAIYCTSDANLLPSYETGAALRTILHWWSRTRSLQMVHGAVVAGPEGCLLLAGASGAGKSSTALACVPSELQFLADDYSLLEFGPEPRLHCVYNVAKVAASDLERMPFLRPIVSNEWELGREKAVFYLHEHMPERLAASALLRAIVLPQQTAARDSRLEPASASAAFIALASSTHVQLPNAGEELVRRLLPVISSIPLYRLELGTDIGQLAPLLTALLRQVGHAPSA